MKSSLSLAALLLAISSCAGIYHPETVNDQTQPVGDAIEVGDNAAAAAVADIIAPYQADLRREMEEVIGEVKITMQKAKPECTLGNWMCDILQRAAVDIYPDLEIAFSVQNYGGIRIPELSAGPLRVRDIYELMPFDNQLVVQEINGFVLNELIQHMAEQGGWPVSKELRYAIRNGAAEDITISGEPLELNRNYVIGVSDYVASGGSNASMLADRPQQPCGRMIRDVLIEYVRKDKEAYAIKLDGRVRRLD